MFYRNIAFFIGTGLLLQGCAGSSHTPSDSTVTVIEGVGLGAVGGAVLGALIGGKHGSEIGAAAGAAVGAAAGDYVAQEKSKYTSIDQRISGEQALAQQSIATAQAQTAASQAQTRNIEAQLAALRQSQQSDSAKAAQSSALLASLQAQHSALQQQQAALQSNIDHQNAMIASTEQDIAATPNDPKTQELAQWKAQIPQMQTALAAMTTQVNEVSAEESKLQAIPALGNS